MNKAILILQQLTIFLTFILIFLGLGRLLIRQKIRFNSFFEEYFISSSLGMLAIILYIIFLSFTGLMYKPALLVIVIGIWGLRGFKVKLNEFLWLVVIFLILFTVFIKGLLPPIDDDGLAYHLPYAQSVIDNHRLILERYLRFPLLPFYGEILQSLGLSINLITPALLSFTALFILVSGCFSEFYKRSYPTIGLIAAFLISTSYALDWSSTNGSVDTFVALFSFSSIIALLNFFEEKNLSWFYVSAALLGGALGTKYSTSYIIIPITLILVFKRQWKLLFQYLLIVFLIASPCFLRNIYYSGNPFWPFIKYSPIWDIYDCHTNYDIFAKDGLEKTFDGVLKLPQYLIKGYVANTFYWFGLILSLFSVFLLRKTRIFYLFCIFVIGTITWFFSINIARYYLCILPVASILATYGYSYILAENRLNSKIIIIILASIIIFYNNLFHYNVVSEISKIPVTEQERNSYLSDKLPGYNAIKFASKLPGKTAVSFRTDICRSSTIFYGNGKAIGDYMGEANDWYIDNYMRTNTDKLYTHLKKLNCNYILIYKSIKDINEIDKQLRVNNLYKVVYEDKNTILYEVPP